MNDLIRDRDERTRERKKHKRKMDKIIGLSYHDKDKHVIGLSVGVKKLSDKRIRLLDEGFFDNGFVIKKGTLERFLNGQNEKLNGWELIDGAWEPSGVLNIDSDFVGSVNLGHMDFATFPFIIGEWTKDDLHLVDIEEDRKGLDVDLRLDEDSVFVNELKRQPYDIGVSAEFNYHINEDDTEALSETLGYYMPVIDEIYIFAYGLVGECGNVNSSGLELKGDSDMDKEKITLDEQIVEQIEQTDDVEEIASETTVETSVEEGIDDADEETTDDEIESDEEVEGEEVTYADVESHISELETEVETLRAEIGNLTAENTALKKSNRRLKQKYENELEKKEAFVNKFSSVAESINSSTEKDDSEKVSSYVLGDGIGE